MQKLYELTESMMRIQEMMEDDLPEDDEEAEAQKQALQDTFEAIEMDYEQKIENCLKYMRSEEALANMYKEEETRIQKMRQAAENRAARIKEMMTGSLEAAGYDYKNKKKIQTSVGKVGFQKNPATIELVDEKKIPFNYISKIEKSFDKRALLADLKEQLENPKEVEEQDFEDIGVKYVNNKYHLRVR